MTAHAAHHCGLSWFLQAAETSSMDHRFQGSCKSGAPTALYVLHVESCAVSARAIAGFRMHADASHHCG
jgi:hypothetical protein